MKQDMRIDVKGTIFELCGADAVMEKIQEARNTCMYSGVRCRVEGHHLLPRSQNGSDDWSNAIYLSRDNHGKLHDGLFNDEVLPCTETWVMRQLGLDVTTEYKEIDVVNVGGIGAGKRMHFMVEVPIASIHVPYDILYSNNKTDISELTDIEFMNRALRDRDKAIKRKSNRTRV